MSPTYLSPCSVEFNRYSWKLSSQQGIVFGSGLFDRTNARVFWWCFNFILPHFEFIISYRDAKVKMKHNRENSMHRGVTISLWVFIILSVLNFSSPAEVYFWRFDWLFRSLDIHETISPILFPENLLFLIQFIRASCTIIFSIFEKWIAKVIYFCTRLLNSNHLTNSPHVWSKLLHINRLAILKIENTNESNVYSYNYYYRFEYAFEIY